MDGGTAKCSAQRLRYEPWSRRKDFWLRKNTSRQVRGEVCLDRADLVIDGMTCVSYGVGGAGIVRAGLADQERTADSSPAWKKRRVRNDMRVLRCWGGRKSAGWVGRSGTNSRFLTRLEKAAGLE